MSSSLQVMSILLSLIITTTYTQQYTTIRNLSLTPISKIVGETFVLTNIREVATFGDEWIVNTYSENQWQFIVFIDSLFDFHGSFSSAIQFTLNTNDAHFAPNDELLFGITSSNTQYISLKIPLFSNSGQLNQIYPACIPSQTSNQLFATGDISSIPQYNRDCDIAGGHCRNWDNMIPLNTPFPPRAPISFVLENHPETDTFSVTFHSSSFPVGFQQICYFRKNVRSNSGLKIYISGSNFGHTYSVSSFDVNYGIKFPTPKPTSQPSKSPTKFPTNQPSKSPTKNPTEFPTEDPTEFPTNQPFKPPTNNPSLTPTKAPTDKPTSPPSTTNPSFNPTPTPTSRPTSPTKYPTFHPTNAPIPNGYEYGAYDQLCELTATNKLCKNNKEILFETDGQILCLQPYDCCMCKSIQCGLGSTACNSLIVGPNGIYGVQHVQVAGNPMNGVDILCEYSESCKEAVIDATYVSYVKCNGRHSCQNTVIVIAHPKNDFVLECIGSESCAGLQIYIDLFAPVGGCNGNVKDIFDLTKIKCGSENACHGMQISVNNAGCDAVRIKDLECFETNSCNGAIFNFFGDVFIENCQCGKSCETAIGLNECFENLEKYQCSDAFACKEQLKTIINPADTFEFICSDTQSCELGNFVIEFNSNMRRQVKNVKGIFMSGLFAGRDAIFTFQNTQGFVMHIEKLECSDLGSCNGLQLITGAGVFVDNVICSADACIGCEIKESNISPGIPCDPSQL